MMPRHCANIKLHVSDSQAKWQLISTKICEIIWNDIKVIEWTWFLYWKLQKGIILQKM